MFPYYSGTPLRRTPLGQSHVSIVWIEGVLYSEVFVCSQSADVYICSWLYITKSDNSDYYDTMATEWQWRIEVLYNYG